MPYYRLYFLENNHIRHFVELECAGDKAAISVASEHGDGRSMELWQEHRMVRHFEATDPRLPKK